MSNSAHKHRPASSLAQLLHWSAKILAATLRGQSLSTALPEVPQVHRPGTQALVFAVLRQWGTAVAVRALLARRRPAPQVDALLCAALALLFEDQPPAYTEFTLVDQAVGAAKLDAATRAQAGFVNACLRRFLRERQHLLEQARAQSAQARWNHPAWWIKRLQQDHPQHWQSLLQSNQQAAPMDLRVNIQRATVAEYLRSLQTAGLQAYALGNNMLRLQKAVPVPVLPGHAEGLVSVQSATAARAAPLLLADLPAAAAPDVLDACAAPGGKTAHMLELLPQARVTALEISATRSRRIHENLQRLGLQAQVQVADAGQPGGTWAARTYDRILLDAPCSASGIVRRHPDIRWLRRPGDMARLAAQQDRLLQALWPLLKPGGKMLFATCSVFRQEGEQRLQAFLQQQPLAQLLPSPGHILPLPDAETGAAQTAHDEFLRYDTDAFFYALLQKPH